MNVQKTCFLTGATSGIGKDVLKLLAEKGIKVIFTARTAEKGEAVKQEILVNQPEANIDYIFGDLTKTADIKNIVTELYGKVQHLDLLINNAATYTHEKYLTAAGYEHQLFVNYMVTRFFCEQLKPLLQNAGSGRIVNVTSRMHLRASSNLSDLNYERQTYAGYKAYAQSKLLMTAYTNYFAETHNHTGITAISMHPGVYSTGITRNLPSVIKFLWNTLIPGPEKGAKYVVQLALEDNSSGTFFNKTKVSTPHPAANDKEFWNEMLQTGIQ